MWPLFIFTRTLCSLPLFSLVLATCTHRHTFASLCACVCVLFSAFLQSISVEIEKELKSAYVSLHVDSHESTERQKKKKNEKNNIKNTYTQKLPKLSNELCFFFISPLLSLAIVLSHTIRMIPTLMDKIFFMTFCCCCCFCWFFQTENIIDSILKALISICYYFWALNFDRQRNIHWSCHLEFTQSINWIVGNVQNLHHRSALAGLYACACECTCVCVYRPMCHIAP